MKAYTYVLNICGKAIIQEPTEKDIREAAFALDSREGEAFLILERVETGTFLQAGGDRDVGFELACQDLEQQQYRAMRDYSAGEIVRAFTSFCLGSSEWRNGSDWEFVGSASPAEEEQSTATA
ncbi:MAG: hypothetical protein ACAI34_12925 [Verrucomicrobium sp.]|nr:hypothetical protein [Verrucomicrobium sp.]